MKAIHMFAAISLVTLVGACADDTQETEIVYGDTLVVAEQVSPGELSAELYGADGELAASMSFRVGDGLQWHGDLRVRDDDLTSSIDELDLADALYWSWQRSQPVPTSGPECICAETCAGVYGAFSSRYYTCIRRCGGGKLCEL